MRRHGPRQISLLQSRHCSVHFVICQIADEHQFVARAEIAIEREQHLAGGHRGPLHDRHGRGQRCRSAASR